MLLAGVAFSSAPALAKQVVVDVLHLREPPGPWITQPVVLNARRKPKLTTHMFDLASFVFASSNLSVSFFGLFLFRSMQFDCWCSIFSLLLFSYLEIDMLSQHPVSEINEACAVIIVSNGPLTNLMSG